MSIKIEMLRCFRAVVEHGSLGTAAKTLNKTASAVSMTLKQFEDHLGAPLFETSRKSKLTPLGEMIYAEALRELKHFQRTILTIEGLSRSKLGQVRVAATSSFTQVVPSSVFEAYMRDCPGVKLELRELSGAEVRAALENEEIDIGIASLDPMPGFDRRLLFQDRYGILCRSDHPLTQLGPEVSWKDVEGYNFVSNPLCQRIRCENSASLIDSAHMIVNSTASLHGLVAAGYGVSMVPEHGVLPGYADLVFLPLKNASRQRQVHIVTPERHVLTPAAQKLVDAIWIARPGNDE